MAKRQKAANDYVLQCRPGRELGAWIESVAQRTKLPVSEVVRRLLVLMQCNFTMGHYKTIKEFAEERGQDFQAACLGIRTALDSVNADRQKSGKDQLLEKEVEEFIREASRVGKSRDDAYFAETDQQKAGHRRLVI